MILHAYFAMYISSEKCISGFGTFVKEKLTQDMLFNFWDLCATPVICVLLCQYQFDLVTIALYYILKFALFFLFNIALAFQKLLCFFLNVSL